MFHVNYFQLLLFLQHIIIMSKIQLYQYKIAKYKHKLDDAYKNEQKGGVIGITNPPKYSFTVIYEQSDKSKNYYSDTVSFGNQSNDRDFLNKLRMDFIDLQKLDIPFELSQYPNSRWKIANVSDIESHQSPQSQSPPQIGHGATCTLITVIEQIGSNKKYRERIPMTTQHNDQKALDKVRKQHTEYHEKQQIITFPQYPDAKWRVASVGELHCTHHGGEENIKCKEYKFAITYAQIDRATQINGKRFSGQITLYSSGIDIHFMEDTRKQINNDMIDNKRITMIQFPDTLWKIINVGEVICQP